MRMILFLLFLLFLSYNNKSAVKTTQPITRIVVDNCLSQMAIDGGVSEATMTLMLVSCSVKQLEGDRIYLNQGDAWRKLRTRLYPRANGGSDDLSYNELAARMTELTACQMMSAVKTEYLRRCELGRRKD